MENDRTTADTVAPPYVDVAKLYPGDVLLSTSSSIPSAGIRFATKSIYSHAAIHIGAGLIIQSTPDDGIAFSGFRLVKAETSLRANIRRLIGTLPPATMLHVYRHENLVGAEMSHHQEMQLSEMLSEAAGEYWGKDYAMLETLGDASALLSHAPAVKQWVLRQVGKRTGADADKVVPGPFCSELVAALLTSVGLSPMQAAFAQVSPGDLAAPEKSVLVRLPDAEVLLDSSMECDVEWLQLRRSMIESAFSIRMTQYRNNQLRTLAALDELETVLQGQIAQMTATLNKLNK